MMMMMMMTKVKNINKSTTDRFLVIPAPSSVPFFLHFSAVQEPKTNNQFKVNVKLHTASTIGHVSSLVNTDSQKNTNGGEILPSVQQEKLNSVPLQWLQAGLKQLHLCL